MSSVCRVIASSIIRALEDAGTERELTYYSDSKGTHIATVNFRSFANTLSIHVYPSFVSVHYYPNNERIAQSNMKVPTSDPRMLDKIVEFIPIEREWPA